MPTYSSVGYEAALSDAWNNFMTKDLTERCRLAVARLDANNTIYLNFFNNVCKIDLSKRTMVTEQNQRLSLTAQILILHYLITVTKTTPLGEWLSFREFYGGEVYFPAFRQRAIQPIAQAFSSAPEKFELASKALGGEPWQQGAGKLKFCIRPLPKIPVVCILWPGDAELPTSAQMLFDKSASEHLHIEDIAVLGEFVAYKLIDTAGLNNPNISTFALL